MCSRESSRQFGFINWEDANNASIRNVIRRAIAALRNILAHIPDDPDATSSAAQTLTKGTKASNQDHIKSSEKASSVFPGDLGLLTKLKLENDMVVADTTPTEMNTASGIMANVTENDFDKRIEFKYEIKEEILDEVTDNLQNSNKGDQQMTIGTDLDSADAAGSNGSVEGEVLQIDPETYCKLGHLHLIMEEFYEGI